MYLQKITSDDNAEFKEIEIYIYIYISFHRTLLTLPTSVHPHLCSEGVYK